MCRFITLVFVLLLAGCSQLRTQPEPPPAATSQAQEITHAQSMTLQKRGTISVTERGSPTMHYARLPRKPTPQARRGMWCNWSVKR